MSTLVRPSGPLPRRVYWFRRLLVLCLLLALVLGVLFWISQSLGAQEPPAEAGTKYRHPVTTDSLSVPKSAGKTTRQRRDAAQRPGRRDEVRHRRQADSRAERRAERRADRRAAKPPPAVPDGPCRAEEVRLEPLVSAHNEAGDPVEIRLELRTTGRAACTLAVGPDNLLVKVTSGSDQWWTSADCPEAIFPGQLVVRADEPVTYRVVWPGTRSTSRCRPEAPAATAGTYVAAAALIGGEPATTEFLLEPASGGGRSADAD